MLRYDAGMENNPYESPTSTDHAREQEPPSRGLTAPQLFGVAARAIGLYFLAYAVFDFSVYVIHSISHDAVFDTSRYLTATIENVAAGFIPFFAPNFLVKMTYRERRLN